MHSLIMLVAVSGPLLCMPQSRPTSATQPATRSTHLDLRINPLVDMHYFVRRHSGESTPLPAVEGLSEAVELVRAFEAALATPAAWGLIEDNFTRCRTAAEALRVCQKLPERRRLRSGRTIAIRQPVVELLRAYARLEPAFQKVVWPQHKTALEAAHRRLHQELVPRQVACFDYILEHLGMQDPRLVIPVYLVAEAPYPGGFTHRRRGRGGVCFVGLEHAGGSLLLEVVLHEASHALDIATLAQDTAFQRLRAGLQQAGHGPRSRIYRDVPHTLLFYQAAETVRRLLIPGHKHYGDAIGYYAKVPRAIQAVRPAWDDYLDGKMARDAALERILSAFTSENTTGD